MKGMELLMQRIGYSFGSRELLKLALTHPSFRPKNNQRLEFLGDAVLELCISDQIYRSHPRMPEGEMTALRAALVCEDTLYQIAEQLELGGMLKTVPPLTATSRGRRSMLADAVEALIAAVYLDGGLEAASQLVLRLWQDQLQKPVQANAKNRLQELLASTARPEPVYETVAEDGPPHKRLFTVRVLVEGGELARAVGASKKAAEQDAAALALKALEAKHEA